MLSVISFGIAIWLLVLAVDATDETCAVKTTEHVEKQKKQSDTYITNNFIIADKQTGDKLLRMMEQKENSTNKEIAYIRS